MENASVWKFGVAELNSGVRILSRSSQIIVSAHAQWKCVENCSKGCIFVKIFIFLHEMDAIEEEGNVTF